MSSRAVFRFFTALSQVKQKIAFIHSLRWHSVKLVEILRIKNGIARYMLSSILPSLFIIKAVSKEDSKDHLQKIINSADVLYSEVQYDQLYNVLIPYQADGNPEILWRLARVLYEKCRNLEKGEKLSMLEEALSLVDKALEINDKCWAAHKWRAILLDNVWQYKSTKGRIINSFEIKKHIKRAIELNPEDSTSYYILGEWCFAFADMPWYQRKIAAAIFASPPTSTYAEALKYFEKAEEISPFFYSMNLLSMAKCLLKLNEKEKAAQVLKQLKNYPLKTADDKQAYSEAVKLLKELKIEN